MANHFYANTFASKIYTMFLDTVIFDIDGLLIDSEPLWGEAADEVFQEYKLYLTKAQYATTTGLRTKEFVEYWLQYFKASHLKENEISSAIIEVVLEKIKHKGKLMNGVQYIFNFFRERNFKIGLATSSPQALIDVVIKMTGTKSLIQATASAEDLQYGKPHPQVYLNCAEKLQSSPLQCVCFEDSFNGMIAVKAARMKCVIVPEHTQYSLPRWTAADLQISSLQNFNALHLERLMQ